MIRYFDDSRTHPARAVQIWLVLIGLARNRQTITYQGLAEVLEFKGEGVFADMLGHIAFYCKENNLPPLTDLVVKKDTGLPGDGLATQVADFNAERERVYQHKWFRMFPPSAEELSESFKRGKAVGG